MKSSQFWLQTSGWKLLRNQSAELGRCASYCEAKLNYCPQPFSLSCLTSSPRIAISGAETLCPLSSVQHSCLRSCPPLNYRQPSSSPSTMKHLVCLCIIFAAAFAQEQTECQRHREREQASNVTGNLVPECDADGSYKGLQCHPGTNPFCQCWAKDGTILTAPSRNIRACECIREKALKEAQAAISIGVFVPSCTEQGTYQKKQCSPRTGHCWCVNEGTGSSESEPSSENENSVSTESEPSLENVTCD